MKANSIQEKYRTPRKSSISICWTKFRVYDQHSHNNVKDMLSISLITHEKLVFSVPKLSIQLDLLVKKQGAELDGFVLPDPNLQSTYRARIFQLLRSPRLDSK